MLQRFIYLKTAIAATLLEIDLDIEFSSAEWALCDKVVTCLKCFEEATKLLSSKEASISSTIPFVSTIIRALETASEDLGIMRMKNRLKGAMIERVRDIENCEHYYLSCLLDPRYKKYFFKDKSNFQHARSVLISKVANSVNSSSKCPMTFCNESTSDQDMTDQQDLSFANLMEKIIAENEVSQCTSICQNHSIDNAEITVDKYLNAIVTQECLEFWKPPTTTDVERLFSTAGDIITD